MSTEKLIELSKPVAQIYYDELDSSVMRIGWFRSDEPKNPESLYSQEYVSALLAELEAKDERIVALERINQAQDDHINQQQDRIDSLEKTNAGLGQRLGAAEKRLATPVRLPTKYSMLHREDFHSDYQSTMAFKADEVIAELRAAGFTVEGDE